MPYRYLFLFIAGVTTVISVLTANIASRAVVATSAADEANAIVPIGGIVDAVVKLIN